MNRSRALLLALLLTAACGGVQAAPGTAPRSRYILTADEIAAAGVNTAYDALMRLQPGWVHGAREGRVGVFINGSMVGDITFLHELPANQIGEARYVVRGALRAELGERRAKGLTGAIMIRTSRPRS